MSSLWSPAIFIRVSACAPVHTSKEVTSQIWQIEGDAAVSQPPSGADGVPQVRILGSTDQTSIAKQPAVRDAHTAKGHYCAWWGKHCGRRLCDSLRHICRGR